MSRVFPNHKTCSTHLSEIQVSFYRAIDPELHQTCAVSFTNTYKKEACGPGSTTDAIPSSWYSAFVALSELALMLTAGKWARCRTEEGKQASMQGYRTNSQEAGKGAGEGTSQGVRDSQALEEEKFQGEKGSKVKESAIMRFFQMSLCWSPLLLWPKKRPVLLFNHLGATFSFHFKFARVEHGDKGAQLYMGYVSIHCFLQ